MGDIKDDIARYHNGQLTPAEMHALESRALNDPFLADALEGTAPLSTMELNDDINQLQARLNDRLQEEKTVPISRWTWPLRIAAGLLVLISATVVVISVQQEKPSVNLALNESKQFAPPVPQKSTPSQDSVVDAEKRIGDEADEPLIPEERKGVSPPAPGRTRNEPIVTEEAGESVELSDAAPATHTPLETKDAIVTPESADKEKPEAEEFDAGKSIAQARPQSEKTTRAPSSIKMDDTELKKRSAAKATEAISGNADALVIKGKVTAEDGTELPGVNINIKGTNIGTVTDIFGDYQLSVAENDPTLVFTFIGYATEEIPAAGSKPDLNVSLSEDATQLSEVVVTGYGIERDPSEINSTLEFATPVGGKKAYKQYLEKNLRYPTAAADAKVEGRVTIQFAIETTGKLSDFKVIKGLGYGCDEEVMRLVKAGPKWSPSKRDKNAVRDLVKVRMRFQLPKK